LGVCWGGVFLWGGEESFGNSKKGKKGKAANPPWGSKEGGLKKKKGKLLKKWDPKDSAF